MKEIKIMTTDNVHEMLFQIKCKHGISAKSMLLKGAFATGLIFQCEQCGHIYFHGEDYGEQASDGCDICTYCHDEWISGQE